MTIARAMIDRDPSIRDVAAKLGVDASTLRYRLKRPAGCARIDVPRVGGAKVPSQLVMLPSGGHIPADDLDAIDKWFRRYLQ